MLSSPLVHDRPWPNVKPKSNNTKWPCCENVNAFSWLTMSSGLRATRCGRTKLSERLCSRNRFVLIIVITIINRLRLYIFFLAPPGLPVQTLRRRLPLRLQRRVPDRIRGQSTSLATTTTQQPGFTRVCCHGGCPFVGGVGERTGQTRICSDTSCYNGVLTRGHRGVVAIMVEA